MPADFLWAAPGSADTLVAGASLNALADGAGAIGAEIDNTSARKTHMDIWFKVDTDRASTGGNERLDFYMIEAPDGTNYPDPPGSTPADVPEGYFIGSMSSIKRGGTVTNFLSGVLPRVPISPVKFKIIVFNELGVPLPSNDNTVLVGYRYNLADA